jgi:hypothetical protein
MHSAYCIDKSNGRVHYLVRVIHIRCKPVSCNSVKVTSQEIDVGEVSILPAVIMAPQPIQELVQPLQEHIMAPVARVLARFSHFGLFRAGRSSHCPTDLPFYEFANSLEQYRVVLLLGIPQSIVRWGSGYSVSRQSQRAAVTLVTGLRIIIIMVIMVYLGCRVELNLLFTRVPFESRLGVMPGLISCLGWLIWVVRMCITPSSVPSWCTVVCLRRHERR